MADRRISVEILGDSRSLERAFGRARSSAGGLAISLGGLVKSIVVVDAVQKAIEGLTGTVHLGIQEFKETTQIQAQTAAALKSTGSVSGETAKQIHSLSFALSNLSGQSDESIQSAENVLLSFTNIRNSLGKNNDIFTRATKIVTDYAARTGKDAPAAAVLFGKALEDPAKRVGILARAGVVLSESQVKVLKSTEKTKGILAAQKILLEELTKRFGGAAKAAGETLGGQLNVLRERFRDLAGEIVGLAAPGVSQAVTTVTDFVRRLSEAKGGHAKFSVAIEGLEGLGRATAHLGADILASVRDAISRIDWGKLASTVREAADKIARQVGDALRSVNWPAAIAQAGHAVGQALVTALNGVSKALKAVDWSKVGKVIVDGLVIAIAATAKFLASVDWGAVVRALVHTFESALLAAGSLLIGIGEELGGLILKGVGKGLTAAGRELEALALKIGLKIVEPFSHLPGIFGGGEFQKLKRDMQDQLASLGDVGKSTGKLLAEKLTQAFSSTVQNDMALVQTTLANVFAIASAGVAQRAVGLRTTIREAALPAIPGPAAASSPSSPLKPVADDLLGHPAKRKGITADQRNTFFDNAITRLLDRVQDVGVKQQITQLQQISGLITERIARTKDITRKLNLEDQLLAVGRQIKSARDQLGQNFLEALNLRLDRAGATKSQQDDLAALAAIQKALEQRIKAEGRTTDLERQLFDVEQKRVAVRQQIAQNRNDARNAAQFKTLGLLPTGDTPIAFKALKDQAKALTDAISGTFLDTSKTRSILSHVASVLGEGMGKVGRVMRETIKGILDDFDKQLKDHQGDQTTFRHIAAKKLLAGFGLTPEQLRALTPIIAQIGPGGKIPQASGQFGLAGGGGTLIPHVAATADSFKKVTAAARTLQSAFVKTPDIIDRTFAQFPGLAKFRDLFVFKKSGPSPQGFQSESFQKGERDSFDPTKRAIELFGNKNKPSDVAGEIVSHFLARGTDPILTRIYKQFVKTVESSKSAMAFLKRDFKVEGEGRSFKQFEQMSGFPALFRGGLFHQLDSGDVVFNKAQQKLFVQATHRLLTPTPTRTMQFAGAGGGTTINGDVHIHDPKNWREIETELAKRERSRARLRRGTG